MCNENINGKYPFWSDIWMWNYIYIHDVNSDNKMWKFSIIYEGAILGAKHSG
jgi:hypothetical protein